MAVLGIIPLRMGSKRLPGKVLLAETGWPVVRHVWEQAKQAKKIDKLVIAFAENDELRAACEAFGATPWITGNHPTGMDRCAEVARDLNDFDIVVNIQADQPEVNPEHIDLLVDRLKYYNYDVATVCTNIKPKQKKDPNIVKLRAQMFGNPKDKIRWGVARSFSRTDYDMQPYMFMLVTTAFRHVGIYAYHRDVLLHLAEAPRPWSELRERLEQRRMEREGCDIACVCVKEAHEPVDVRAQYDAFVARWRAAHPAQSAT
jgi:3-deoxy-manno-octulosonate cytidylyltransferase (CMP-KDO synthetase)